MEALNNINVCITFPTMFYCLGKAARVHMINIASNQPGLANAAFRNIVKTLKICRFYVENNVLPELANQTIKALENVLMNYQEKLPQESVISPSDHLSSSSRLSSPQPNINNIKISTTTSNQATTAFGESAQPLIAVSPVSPGYVSYSSPMTSQSGMLNTKRTTSPPTLSIQPASPSASSPQSFSYVQHSSSENATPNTTGGQQYLSVPYEQYHPTMQIQSPTMISASPVNNENSDMSSTDSQIWLLPFGGFNSPYGNQITVASPVSATPTTPTPSSAASPDYFNSQQQQQLSPQPTTTVSTRQRTLSNSSFKTLTTTRQMSLDSTDHDNEHVITELRNVGLQNVHNSQRYVFMDTNESNNSAIAHNNDRSGNNCNDNGDEFITEGVVFGRMANETHPRIFNKIPRRITRSKEEEGKEEARRNGVLIPDHNGLTTATATAVTELNCNSHQSINNPNLHNNNNNAAEAIYLLSRRPSGGCGLTFTPIGMGCGDDDFDQQYDGIQGYSTIGR